ncbi:hypothetical protein FRC12_023518 [Ceratobasidium sp. 428]|nr:hypothetical protein FRC12_023518 [Ceratobasidium sp. 428]
MDIDEIIHFYWVNRLSDQLTLVNQNSGFIRLKRIKIVGVRNARENFVLSLLGGMQSLGSWIQRVPSLESVNVYGVELK